MPERVRRIGVTGASGYIGLVLVDLAAREGREVVALGRRSAQGASEWRPADLAHPPADDLLDGLDGVVHLAAETGGGVGVGIAAELAFAEALARAAEARGLPCVFVSSQAAGDAAPNEYGRRKAALERTLLPLGVIVVRPGMVIGGPRAGLQGQLRALAARSPLLPRLWPAPSVQPVHVEDLAQALLHALDGAAPKGHVLMVAGPPVPFHALLAGFARHDARRRVAWLPVPVALLRWVLANGAWVAGPRFAPERLDSLLALPQLEATADLVRLGLTLRPLEDALDRRGRPLRAWLREADALARALLGRAAPPSALRRYVTLMRRRIGARPLSLPPSLLDHPGRIAALDGPVDRREARPLSLAWRLSLMLRVLEATPALVEAFLALPGRAGRARLLAALARTAVRELIARLRRPLARCLLARAGGGAA